jgi:hypothetical protein
LLKGATRAPHILETDQFAAVGIILHALFLVTHTSVPWIDYRYIHRPSIISRVVGSFFISANNRWTCLIVTPEISAVFGWRSRSGENQQETNRQDYRHGPPVSQTHL